MRRKCNRTRARDHAVCRVDVGLDQDRYAIQGPESAARPLPVQPARNREGVGVDFDHGVERRAIIVQRGDPAQKHPGHVLG